MKSQPEPHPSLFHEVPLPPQRSKRIIIQIQEQLLPFPPSPKAEPQPQPQEVADKSLILSASDKFSYGLYYSLIYNVLK